MVPVLRVAEPLVDDAMAADPGDAAVEDGELAMVALRDDADVLQRARVVERELAAGRAQLVTHLFAHLPGALGIEDQAHDDAARAPLRIARPPGDG